MNYDSKSAKLNSRQKDTATQKHAFRLDKHVGPVVTYCAAVRLVLRNPNLNPDL